MNRMEEEAGKDGNLYECDGLLFQYGHHFLL